MCLLRFYNFWVCNYFSVKTLVWFLLISLWFHGQVFFRYLCTILIRYMFVVIVSCNLSMKFFWNSTDSEVQIIGIHTKDANLVIILFHVEVKSGYEVEFLIESHERKILILTDLILTDKKKILKVKIDVKLMLSWKTIYIVVFK